MKKIAFLIFCAMSQLASLQAFDIEARVAYFYPQDHRLRDVYGKCGWVDYEIEAATPLGGWCGCSCDWDAWINASYYQKSGRSTCLHNRTKMDNWTLNIGLKRYFDMCKCFRPYLGFGVGFAHVHFHDKSPFVKEHTNRWGFAFLAKSGLRYDVTCNIFMDLFMDYAFSQFSFRCVRGVSTHSINTGGLKVGLGLGYQF